MPYQNNNNRIVSKGQQGLISITPQARITDQLIIPKNTIVEQSELNKATALAGSIAAIGKGLQFYDTVQQIQAEGVAEAMIAQDEINKDGQHNYKEAAKDLDFLNKINPYVQNRYQELAVKDFSLKAQTDFISNPNLTYMSEEEFNQTFNNTLQRYKEQCKAVNIPVRVAGKEMADLYEQMNKLRQKAIAEREMYHTELGYNRAAQQLGHEIVNLFETGNKDEQYTGLSVLFKKAKEENLSIPETVFLQKVLIQGLKNGYKTIDPDTYVDEEALISSIKDFMTDSNINAETVDLGLIGDIKNVLKTIKREKREEERQMRIEKELKEKEIKEELDKTFMQELIDGKFDDNPDLAQVRAKELCNEAGMPEYYNNLMQDLVQSLRYNSAIQDEYDDIKWQETEKMLDNAWVNGRLDTELVQTVIQAGFPYKKVKPYVSLLAQEERVKKQEAKTKAAENAYQVKQAKIAYDGDFKSLEMKYTKNPDIKKALREYITLDETGHQVSLYSEYDSGLAQINSKASHAIANGDSETLYECITDLKSLDSAINMRLMAPIPQLPKNPASAVLSLPVRSQWDKSQFTNSNVEKDSEIFTAAGFVKDGFKNTDIQLSRGIQRGVVHPATGEKKTDHIAYDLALKGGTALRVPQATKGMVLEAAGYSQSLGFYMLFRLQHNGVLMRVAHLQAFDTKRLKTGTFYSPNQMFGRVGRTGIDRTGISTGDHVDIQFYNKDANGYLTVQKALGTISKGKLVPRNDKTYKKQ